MITHASLFSGLGAADLAATWMGWNNAFWCEIDDFARKVLSYWFPNSKRYGNIKETDFTEWEGKIDVLTGGFPCQPFSTAGKRRGAEDDRYLWPEMLRAIREIRPYWVVGENVAGITSMVQPGSEVTVESQASLFETSDKETLLEQVYVIETICSDLEHEGYSVQPVVIPACSVGAPHRRDRVWFIAHRSDAGTESLRQERKDKVHGCLVASDTDSPRFQAKGSEQQTTGITGDGLQKDVTDTYGDKLQTWLKNNGREIEKKNISRLDNGVERSCRIRTFADSDNERLSIIGITDRVSSEEREKKRRCLIQYTSNDWPALSAKRWKDFPTQPPVRGRNDGLPFDVDHLTVSYTRWRTESIKGYGNAIVPHVIYEIFKAIEMVE